MKKESGLKSDYDKIMFVVEMLDEDINILKKQLIDDEELSKNILKLEENKNKIATILNQRKIVQKKQHNLEKVNRKIEEIEQQGKKEILEIITKKIQKLNSPSNEDMLNKITNLLSKFLEEEREKERKKDDVIFEPLVIDDLLVYKGMKQDGDMLGYFPQNSIFD